MINKFTEKVGEFHKAFGINTLDITLRYNLFKEELEEYIEGSKAREKGLKYFNTAKNEYVHTETYILDAVCDMYYILAGTFDLHKYKPTKATTIQLDERILINDLIIANDLYLKTTLGSLHVLSTLLTSIVHYNGFENIIETAFNIVHDSNMSKLDDNGKPIINGQNGVLDETRPLGKVLKSSKFYEPTKQLKQLLDEKNS